MGVEMGTRALPSNRAPFNKLFQAIQQRGKDAHFAELYCNNVLYNTLILPQAFQPVLVRPRIIIKSHVHPEHNYITPPLFRWKQGRHILIL
jgi:hypothetical protein